MPRSTCCARASPRFPPKRSAGILFEQELASEDDPEVDALAERVEAAGALAEDSWFALSAADRERFRQFRHALPELVNDTVRRNGTPQDGHRLRRPAGAQSRDAGVLPAAAGSRNFPAAT